MLTPNVVTAKAILIKLPQILLGKREAHQVIKHSRFWNALLIVNISRFHKTKLRFFYILIHFWLLLLLNKDDYYY